MSLIQCSILVVLTLTLTVAGHAQTSVPTLSQTIPAQRLDRGTVTLDLRNYFTVPGISGPVVQFVIQYSTPGAPPGRVNVEMLAADAPRHVANFLTYTGTRVYDNTIIDEISNLQMPDGTSVVQGGGFSAATLPPTAIAKNAPVALEYGVPNNRGTLAALRGTDVNSATNRWFFNTKNSNAATFGPAAGGGYSVFGRVLGNGLSVIDAIGLLPTDPPGGNGLPLRNTAANQTVGSLANYVVVSSVRQIAVYPTVEAPTAVLSFAVSAATAGIVAASIEGSTLTLTPLAAGAGTVAVRATDSNGLSATGTIDIHVPTGALFFPAFSPQPNSQVIASGSTAVFSAATTGSGAASFQWFRQGVAVPGATQATLVLRSATSANAGNYRCVATNAVGSTASAEATLTVIDAPAHRVGRLTNLSVLGIAGGVERTLTVGVITGPSDSAGRLPLLVRAIGPGLQPFNISGTDVLPDPELIVNRVGDARPATTNDNWGGTAALSAAFAAVGAFRVPADSLDSAVLFDATAASYTLQIKGKVGTSGLVIAELYDRSTMLRSADTPHLVNVSTLSQIDAGEDLTAGIIVDGQTARTVLVRGVGPSLEVFGVDGVIADPKLELFDSKGGQPIGENDDWGGNAQLAAVGKSVGAFDLRSAASKDAVLLVTLPPGAYSARVKDTGNNGGSVLLEVYEVP